MPPQTQPASLPGVFALIGISWRRYTARRSTYLSMGLIAFAAIASLPVLAALIGAKSLAAVSVIALIAIAYIVVILWVMVAFMNLVRGHDENLSISAAFGRAGRQLLPFLWLGIVTSLIVFGAIAVFAGIPAAIIAFGGAAVAGGSSVPMVIAAVYGIIALVVVGVLFGNWGALAVWIFLDDQNYRGIKAYAGSRSLVRAAGFWAVFGRVLAFSLLFGIVAGIVNALFRAIGGNLVGLVAYYLLAGCVLYPLMFGAMFALYEAARSRVGAAPQTGPLGWWRAAAIAGLVAIVLVPLLAGALIVSYLGKFSSLSNPSGALTSGTSGQLMQLHDTIRQANLRGLQADLTLLHARDGSYPMSLSAVNSLSSAQMQTTDPYTHAPYDYRPSADGSAYTLCATLEAGGQFCVDSTG